MDGGPEYPPEPEDAPQGRAMRPAAWLDEFWSVVLALPLVFSFVPWVQDFVSRGFRILQSDAPGWYLGAVGLAVAWAFGRRALPPMVESMTRGRDIT